MCSCVCVSVRVLEIAVESAVTGIEDMSCELCFRELAPSSFVALEDMFLKAWWNANIALYDRFWVLSNWQSTIDDNRVLKLAW